MDVSVIIVNYNTRSMLRDCLRSIEERTTGISYEIIVVDNASSDGSASMVLAEHPNVILVQSNENLGFGRANNLGTERAQGDFLFFLNSDTILINNAILELFSFIKRTPRCAIVGGNLYDREGCPIHSHSMALPFPSMDLLRLVPGSFRLLFGKNWTHNFSGKPIKVGYVTGADLMIPADLFRSVNGFDRAYFMYYEETELTARIRSLGYLVYSVPSARIVHIKGGSLENISSMKEIVFVSKFRYMRKLYGRFGAWRSYAFFGMFSIVKIAFNSIRGKHTSVSRYLDALSLQNRIYRDETTWAE